MIDDLHASTLSNFPTHGWLILSECEESVEPTRFECASSEYESNVIRATVWGEFARDFGWPISLDGRAWAIVRVTASAHLPKQLERYHGQLFFGNISPIVLTNDGANLSDTAGRGGYCEVCSNEQLFKEYLAQSPRDGS